MDTYLFNYSFSLNSNMTGVCRCRTQGVFTAASHVAGAAKAAELSELSGAVGSLAMVAAGIMTTAIIPVMLSII